MTALLLTTMMTAHAATLIAPSDVVGVELQRMNPQLRRDLDAPGGVLVTEVRPHSPAAQADLQPGDVLLQLDNTTLHNPTQLNVVLSVNHGEEVALLLLRDGDLLRMDVDIPAETWIAEARHEPGPVDVIVYQREEIEVLQQEIATLQAHIDALEAEMAEHD